MERVLKTGDVLYAPTRSMLGLATHFAVYFENGLVVDCSPTNHTNEYSLENFIENYPDFNVCYPDTDLPQKTKDEIKARYKKIRGLEYNLFTWNCEHVATYIINGFAISKQVLDGI